MIGKLAGRLGKSILYKMIFSYVIVILIPIVILGSISYYKNVEIIETKSGDDALKLLQLMSEKIDTYIGQIEQISYVVYQDNMQELLTTPNDTDDIAHIRMEEKMNDIFGKWLAYLNFGGDIRGINIIKSDGVILHSGDGAVNPKYNLVGSEWYKKAIELGGSKLLAGPHNEPYLMMPKVYNPKISPNILEYRFISFLKEIRDMSTSDIIGAIMIDFNLNEFNRLLSPLKIGNDSKVYVVDQDQTIIYDMNKELIGKKLDHSIAAAVFLGKAGKYTADIDKKKVLVTYYTSGYTGWKFVNINQIDTLISETAVIKRVTILIGLISFGIAVIISVIMSLTLTRPLKKLKRLMGEVIDGDFGVEIEVRSKDEVGQLSFWFNKMVSHVRHLIDEVYKTQLKEKEAHLNALQAQINPHFLYNTLESVNSIAQVNDIEEISIISKALAEMFRYSIKQGKHIVMLEDEINHVNNYIKIQKIRFGSRINFDLDVPADALKLKIIKLVIQPLVENSIYHGLELKPGKGTISIKVLRNAEELSVIIEDNGLGIEQEKLAAIRNALESGTEYKKGTMEDEKEHVGLVNVHSRIRFYFGNEYGLLVESRIKEGTRVIMKLPVIE